jgi:hypothetical protein
VYGLTTLLSVQCIISFIHGILLFQYQPLLFDLCLEKQTIEVFWWPLGGTQNNPMMKKVNDACGLEWHRFAKQRIVTLCVYNVILVSFLINRIRIGG